jgi:hypothetical protein
MIEKYTKKLLKTIPTFKEGELRTIDLVLDSGIFNGSYQIGALYMLKEMEKNKMMKIERISGASIGSICGLLYFINKLDFLEQFYSVTIKYFRKNKNVNILHDLIDNQLRELLPDDIHLQISKKIYMCYYNIKKRKKIVKKTYHSVDDVLNTLKRTSFCPIFINGDILFEKKYLDGINPFIFSKSPKKKILYVDLWGYDKIFHIFSVKNEKSNIHRILAGVLDIHLFFIKNAPTQMCSYVDDWSTHLWCKNRVVKLFIEKLAFYFVWFYFYINRYIPNEFKETKLMVLFLSIIKEVNCMLIEYYCL